MKSGSGHRGNRKTAREMVGCEVVMATGKPPPLPLCPASSLSPSSSSPFSAWHQSASSRRLLSQVIMLPLLAGRRL